MDMPCLKTWIQSPRPTQWILNKHTKYRNISKEQKQFGRIKEKEMTNLLSLYPRWMT